MAPVDVRQLEITRSRYPGRGRAGEALVVTARRGGGKPGGARRPPRVTGPSVVEAVIGDRRSGAR